MAELKLFIALKAFIERDGKILVLREAGSYADGTNAGKYDFPGGKMKPGETYDEALKREVREEAGIEVITGQPFFISEWRRMVRGEEWQIVGVFIRCTAKSANVALSADHDTFEWIDPTKHRDYPLIPVNHEVFEAYVK